MSGRDESASQNVIIEQRSKVKITMNAKHEAQWEISVVEGADEEEVVRLRRIAIEQHKELVQQLLAERPAA